MSDGWRVIPGFGCYLIQRDGTIFSTRTNIFLKTHLTRKGYYHVGLISDSGRPRSRPVHLLLLTTFKPKKKPWLVCRHLNGIRTDNRLENLEWGTVAQNNRDRQVHGTNLYGERHPMVKLREKQVIEIKRSYFAGEMTRRQISESYGIGRATVDDIVTGTTWKYLNKIADLERGGDR